MTTSFLFGAVRRGALTHITIRAGTQAHSRAKAGTIILENGEWGTLRSLLVRPGETPDHDAPITKARHFAVMWADEVGVEIDESIDE